MSLPRASRKLGNFLINMEGMKRCISSGGCCVVRELKHCMIVCTVFRICMYTTCFTSRTLWQVTSCP